MHYPFTGLKQLLALGQSDLVIDLLKSRLHQEHQDIYNSLLLLAARRRGLLTSVLNRSVNAEQIERNANKLTLDLEAFVDEFSRRYQPRMAHEPTEREGFDEPTYLRLSEAADFARTRDIFVYTPVILWHLLKVPASATASLLDGYRPGLAVLLEFTFKQFIENELIVKRMGHGYSEFSWMERQEVKIGNELAWLTGKGVITETLLVAGIFCSNSRTVHQVENKLKLDRVELIERAISFNRQVTPDLNF